MSLSASQYAAGVRISGIGTSDNTSTSATVWATRGAARLISALSLPQWIADCLVELPQTVERRVDPWASRYETGPMSFELDLATVGDVIPVQGWEPINNFAVTAPPNFTTIFLTRGLVGGVVYAGDEAINMAGATITYISDVQPARGGEVQGTSQPTADDRLRRQARLRELLDRARRFTCRVHRVRAGIQRRPTQQRHVRRCLVRRGLHVRHRLIELRGALRREDQTSRNHTTRGEHRSADDLERLLLRLETRRQLIRLRPSLTRRLRDLRRARQERVHFGGDPDRNDALGQGVPPKVGSTHRMRT